MQAKPIKWTYEEFFAEYYQQLPKHKNYELAYNHVEQLHERACGSRRFSSYAVFRATISRYFKTGRNI